MIIEYERAIAILKFDRNIQRPLALRMIRRRDGSMFFDACFGGKPTVYLNTEEELLLSTGQFNTYSGIRMLENHKME